MPRTLLMPDLEQSTRFHPMLAVRRVRSPDLFAKCDVFADALSNPEAGERFERHHRAVVDGPLGARVRVITRSGTGRNLICFDSNSYLGLHRHPRVLEAVRHALNVYGYGTPSAQLLCGTSRLLQELEDTISAFHGREATLIFSSGYVANVGVLTALLGERDTCLYDRFVHASIHDGCRWSRCGRSRVFPHGDMAALERLAGIPRSDEAGLLIISDGVFSMHGRVAQLPQLRAVADRSSARLMVDDAHGIGVLGATGRGIEEHYGLPGSVDVLVGTFSKSCGALGGYVTGSRSLIDYLRCFAHPAMFTAAMPASLCAGVREAFRLILDDGEARERLWRNVRRTWELLRDAGLRVSPPESPILVVAVGPDDLLCTVSNELLDDGIKCGSVTYPAVPLGESILRIAVTASHDDSDIDGLVRAMRTAADRHPYLREGDT